MRRIFSPPLKVHKRENFISSDLKVWKPQAYLPIRGLKGTVPRDFRLQVFYESVSPKPLIIPLGRFEFFRKYAQIYAAQGAPPVSLTPLANEKKSSIRKVSIIFLEHLCKVELTYR
jgi:hypothetical protein